MQSDIESRQASTEASIKAANDARDALVATRDEVSAMERLLRERDESTADEASQVQSLLEQRDRYGSACDARRAELQNAEEELESQGTKLRELRLEKDELLAEIDEVDSRFAKKGSEKKQQERRKEKLEKQRQTNQDELEQMKQNLADAQMRVTERKMELRGREEAVREGTHERRAIENQIAALDVKVGKFQGEAKGLRAMYANMLRDKAADDENLRKKQVLIQAKRDEITSLLEERDQLGVKVSGIERSKMEAVERKQALQADLEATKREVVLEKQAAMGDQKKKEELMRAKEIVNQKRGKSGVAQIHLRELMRLKENSKSNHETEISVLKAEAQAHRKAVFQAEKQKEKLHHDFLAASNKLTEAMDVVRVQDERIVDMQKRVALSETKVRQQQNLYEQVRSERNAHSRVMTDLSEEISVMKRQFDILNRQIGTLNEEIGAKERELVSAHVSLMKVEREKETLKADVELLKTNTFMAKQTFGAQGAEMTQLKHIIDEADTERGRQRKEYDIVVNERDILGTQLIKRNEELKKLCEKIRVQRNQLSRGEAAYRQRLKSIVELNGWIDVQRNHLDQMRDTHDNTHELRIELFRLQRALLLEQGKAKALTDELQNPLNIHRWRKLKGSDPAAFELLRKIHRLQRRVIEKNEVVEAKDMEIQEKEREYIQVKNMLARHPGPEVAEQLAVYQANLKEKQRQLKAMNAELQMYTAQVNETKYDIDRLKEEQNELGAEFFERRRTLRNTQDEKEID